jgi:putative RecB family exonuclease
MDHLSSSQINLYLLCGLKYRFQYVDQYPKPFRPSALAFGSAFHSTLQWFHEQSMQGKQVSLETLYRIFDADWFSQKLSLTIRFKDGEQEMVLRNVGKEFLTMYVQEETKPVKGCEIPFTVPLYNPATGKELGIPLTGFFDAVETDDTIVEYKTSAQTLGFDNLASLPQLTAYSYAFEILYHKPPTRLKVVNFVKAKKPKMMISETKRSKEDYRGYLYLATEVFKGIRAGYFIPRTGYWCKDCEYLDLCPLWQKNYAATEHAAIPQLA